MWCERNSNKFATCPKEIPDPFIKHTKNPLKSGFGKNVIMSILFST